MSATTATVSIELRRHKHFLAWEDFHRKNRNVMQAITGVMDELIEKNVKSFSVKEIILYLRFTEKLDSGMRTNIYFNDAYISIYAHVIADTHPRTYGKYIQRRPLPASKS